MLKSYFYLFTHLYQHLLTISIYIQEFERAPERSQDDQTGFSDLYAEESVQPLKRGAIEEEHSNVDVKEEETSDEVKTETKKASESNIPGVIDPRLLDSMDPETMMRILTGKVKPEEVKKEESVKEEFVAEEEEEDDPNDMSIPINPSKLLRQGIILD